MSILGSGTHLSNLGTISQMRGRSGCAVPRIASACQVQVKRRTDDHPCRLLSPSLMGSNKFSVPRPPQLHTIRNMILEKGQLLETEQMFREGGEAWPVIIPDEELRQPALGIKPRKAEEK